MKENFTITDKETGKVYWISRAMAVAGVIIAKHKRKWFVLLERRGPGCPDNVGKLCGVCGYLNWGETRKEALIREGYEETGFKANPENIIELQTIDDPARDARENIVTRYAVIADYDEIVAGISNNVINIDTKSRGGEADEVTEFEFSTVEQLENIPSENFAFGHKEMIYDIINEVESRTFWGKTKNIFRNLFNKH